MPNKVSFSGFVPGTSVSIDGVQTTSWGRVVQAAFPFDQPPEPTPGVDVQIKFARSNLQVAPEGFNFELEVSGFDTDTLADTSVYDASFHDKYVFWDYGDGYAYDAPEFLVNPRARDSRYSRGPLGSHTYRRPGEYVVTALVYEPASSKWGRGVLRIGGAPADTPIIKDPDRLFEGLNTIYVNTTGVYSDAPINSTRVASTLAQALAMALSSTAAVRIMLTRDQIFEMDAGFSYRTSNTSQRNITIVAEPGAGAKPIVRPSASYAGGVFFFDQAARDVLSLKRDLVFVDVDFQGGWDTATESGPNVPCIGAAGNASAYMLVDGCVFDGWDIVITGEGVPTRDSYVINDTVITNWRNMGILDGLYTWAGFTGNRITQNPDALCGGPKNGQHNEHGPFRFSQSNKLTVQSCDLYSGTGWFGNGAIFVPQPCIRYNTSSSPGARVNIQSCTMEGGTDIISFGNSDAASVGAPINAVIDSNMLVGSAFTTKAISSSYSGMSVRNNLFVIPDVQRDMSDIGAAGPSIPFGFVACIEYNQNTPENYTTAVSIYNNTVVNLLSATHVPSGTGALPNIFFDGFGKFTGGVVESNLLYEPNQVADEVADGALITIPGFNPRYRGYRDSATVPDLQVQYETPDNAGQLWIPTSDGTGVLGAALLDPPPPVDFFGTARPAENHALGAFELPSA